MNGCDEILPYVIVIYGRLRRVRCVLYSSEPLDEERQELLCDVLRAHSTMSNVECFLEEEAPSRVPGYPAGDMLHEAYDVAENDWRSFDNFVRCAACHEEFQEYARAIHWSQADGQAGMDFDPGCICKLISPAVVRRRCTNPFCAPVQGDRRARDRAVGKNGRTIDAYFPKE